MAYVYCGGCLPCGKDRSARQTTVLLCALGESRYQDLGRCFIGIQSFDVQNRASNVTASTDKYMSV